MVDWGKFNDWKNHQNFIEEIMEKYDKKLSLWENIWETILTLAFFSSLAIFIIGIILNFFKIPTIISKITPLEFILFIIFLTLLYISSQISKLLQRP